MSDMIIDDAIVHLDDEGLTLRQERKPQIPIHLAPQGASQLMDF